MAVLSSQSCISSLGCQISAKTFYNVLRKVCVQLQRSQATYCLFVGCLTSQQHASVSQGQNIVYVLKICETQFSSNDVVPVTLPQKIVGKSAMICLG